MELSEQGGDQSAPTTVSSASSISSMTSAHTTILHTSVTSYISEMYDFLFKTCFAYFSSTF